MYRFAKDVFFLKAFFFAALTIFFFTAFLAPTRRLREGSTGSGDID